MINWKKKFIDFLAENNALLAFTENMNIDELTNDHDVFLAELTLFETDQGLAYWIEIGNKWLERVAKIKQKTPPCK